MILDADDVFLPARLEALRRWPSAALDLDILTTDAYLTVGDRVVRRCYEGGWTFATEDQRREILRRNFIVGHVAVRRTELSRERRVRRSSRTGPTGTWCRMLLDGSRAGLVDEPLARYRLRRSSLSANRAELLDGRCQVLERAASREDLTLDERRRAQAALATERRNALLTRTSTALRERSPHARRLALRVARTPSLPARTRAKAALAALAPEWRRDNLPPPLSAAS